MNPGELRTLMNSFGWVLWEEHSWITYWTISVGALPKERVVELLTLAGVEIKHPANTGRHYLCTCP